MHIIRLDMIVKFFIFVLLIGRCDEVFGGTVPSPEREYQLNDTSAEITNASMQYQDISGPPDSHEAMNNREFNQNNREKRSFEFLVGLINNNSKYEVIRSDPELSVGKGILRKTEGSSPEATKLLLDLLAKIVTYPEHWNQIHKILTNLDQDISSSQHILYQQQQQQQSDINSPHSNTELQRKSEEEKLQQTKWRKQSFMDSATMKWPTFDEIEDDYPTSSTKPEAHSYSEKSAYQKNFAYHKVTGKPTHLKKTPTAYISVSAVAPKPSETEDDYMLETELHQLKPWKNKQHSNNQL
ncbi:uncharacterized protein [Euwallacea fornicatus]|uniref:uncharacterized protein isoform X2 n=1 Tax=Euwallacea fornicatus TaxID=995702 RepID=UPI00338E6E7F